MDVQVADGLHGQLRQAAINPVLGVEAGVDEILDVIGVDLVDGRLAEVRREVDPDLRLVVGEGRVGLAAATGELLNAAVADLGDGHPSRHRRRRGVCLQHQLSQPSLCLRSGETVAAPGLAHRSERALDHLAAQVPLAIPAIALLEHGSGAAGTPLTLSRRCGLGRLLGAHDLIDAIGRSGVNASQEGELICALLQRTVHSRRRVGTPRSRESIHASIDSRLNLTARPRRMCGSRPARTSRYTQSVRTPR
ncbi:MAG TPA: hypothetical protein VMJ65_14415 [Solirubrobacteraceae bacterium]|nr:hypothetical protein [Solirubrobacteraceae bacterium]